VIATPSPATASDVRTPASNATYPRANRRASLAEQGYLPARFGGIPVLVGPELAAQLRAIRGQQS
jgi:hypothetical protein